MCCQPAVGGYLGALQSIAVPRHCKRGCVERDDGGLGEELHDVLGRDLEGDALLLHA